MKFNDANPPAIVASAVTLADLAARINGEHAAGLEATRRGLEHYRAAGQALQEARQNVGHGKWLAWLKVNCPDVGERQARRYMELAKSDVTSDLEYEWRRIQRNPSLAEQQPSPSHTPPTGALAATGAGPSPNGHAAPDGRGGLPPAAPAPSHESDPSVAEVDGDEPPPPEPPTTPEQQQQQQALNDQLTNWMRRFPYSDQLTDWIATVGQGIERIEIAQRGLASMLGRRELWNWQQVGDHILPMLQKIEETARDFQQQIRAAYDALPAAWCENQRAEWMSELGAIGKAAGEGS
jgi:hypothetical protein